MSRDLSCKQAQGRDNAGFLIAGFPCLHSAFLDSGRLRHGDATSLRHVEVAGRGDGLRTQLRSGWFRPGTLVEDLMRDRNRYPVPGKDWRSTIGMFDGDPLFKEMTEETSRRREEERRQAREEEQRESP